MERKTERLSALVVAADRLARKFEPGDVAQYPKLANLAVDWLLDLPRPTEDGFLLDMWLRANSGTLLSLGQLKGVLNTIVARERRARPAAPAPAAKQFAPMAWHLRDVPNGRYRVEFGDGSSIAVRLSDMDVEGGSDWARKQPKGTRNVSLLTQGADGWTGSGWISPDGVPQGRAISTPSVRQALEILARADSTLQYGVAFARIGNVCYICGRNLDTAESIDAGYGPVCADKYGLPWGNKRTPEAVKTAREAAVIDEPEQAGPVVEAAPDELEALKAASDLALGIFKAAVGTDAEDAAWDQYVEARQALKRAIAAREAAQAASAPEVAPVAAPAPEAPQAAPVRAPGDYYSKEAIAARNKQMHTEAAEAAAELVASGRYTEAQARRYVEIFGDAEAAKDLHYDPLTRSYTR